MLPLSQTANQLVPQQGSAKVSNESDYIFFNLEGSSFVKWSLKILGPALTSIYGLCHMMPIWNFPLYCGKNSKYDHKFYLKSLKPL